MLFDPASVVFDASNRFHTIYLRRHQIDRNEFRGVMEFYCKELSKLSKSERAFEYFQDVAEAASNSETREHAYKMLTSFEAFAKLIYLEEILLKDSGVSDAFASYITSKISLLSWSAQESLEKITDARSFMNEIDNLARVTCAALEEIEQCSEPTLRFKFASTLTAFGGQLLASVNGFAPSVFPQFGSTIFVASNALGFALTRETNWPVRERFKKKPKKPRGYRR